MGKLKNPVPTPGKKIGLPSTQFEDSNSLPPAFCFRHLVPAHGVAQCTQEEKSALADTLWQLSQRKWLELILAWKGDHG